MNNKSSTFEGLGKAMTEMFLRSGASAFILSRNEQVLKETAHELQEKTKGKVGLINK